MLEVMQFIFSSFWVWSGTAILIAIAVNGVSDAIASLRGRS